MTNNDKWAEYKDFDDLTRDLGLSTEEVAAAKQVTDSYVRAWRLAQVRKAQRCSQRDIADAMGVSQPRVSAIEHGDLEKVSLSTLRAYAEALGGKLRVVVDFDDQQYVIS